MPSTENNQAPPPLTSVRTQELIDQQLDDEQLFQLLIAAAQGDLPEHLVEIIPAS